MQLKLGEGDMRRRQRTARPIFPLVAALAAQFTWPASGQERVTTVEQRAGQSIHVAHRKGYPLIAVGPANASRVVRIYISPTCNFCNRLYIELVGSIRKTTWSERERQVFGTTEFAIYLYPREPADIPIIKTLLCVPASSFPKSVDDYYRSLWSELFGRPISSERARRTADRIAEASGVRHYPLWTSTSETGRLAADREGDMRTMQTLILLSDNQGERQLVETIEYEGKLWLAPQWIVSQDRKWQSPERLVRLDTLDVRRSHSGEYQYFLSSKIPKAVLFGPIPTAREIGYEVVERPSIRAPLSGN